MSEPIVLGLDFGGSKIAAAVGDIDGALLQAATIDTRPADDAVATFERGIALAQDLVEQLARPLAAVGACTFGIPSHDGVALAPTIDGWGRLPFGRRLGEVFGPVPVRLATDVKAAAYAESRSGALADCDPAIYLNLGTGLAVAIVTGGVVLNGAHGAAGEIGYNLRTVADVGLPVDGRAPLEERVSGQAFHRVAASVVPGAGSAAEIFAAAAEHPGAARMLDELIAELAFHLVNLTVAVDPARIAVGGGMVRSWPQLRVALRRALDAGVPYPPELVAAAYPYDAPLRGVLALAAASNENSRQSTPA